MELSYLSANLLMHTEISFDFMGYSHLHFIIGLLNCLV